MSNRSVPHRLALSVSRGSALDALVLSAASILSVWIRLPKLNLYMGTDDGIYAASMWLMHLGYRVYVDFVLVQPPLFFWLVTWLWRILGLESPYAMWAVAKLVSVAAYLGVMALVYRLGYKLNGRASGLIAILLYQLSTDTFIFSVASCPQLLATFFITAAVYVLAGWELSWKSCFVSGTTLGLAVMTRFSALYVLPVYAGYLIWRAGHVQERNRYIAIALLGLTLPLTSLLTIPFEALRADLVAYHLTKSAEPVSIELKLSAFWEHVTTMELPVLLGLVSIAYILSTKKPSQMIVAGSALSLLGGYFSQPVMTSQHLIESAPFFTVTAAVALSSLIKSSASGRDRKVLLSIGTCSVLLLAVFLPSSLGSLERAILRRHSDNWTVAKLAPTVQSYASPDEWVFCQLTVIPFLADRRCPPLADIDWVNKQLELYTPDTVKLLIQTYPLKVVVVTNRIANEMREFLADHGYTRVERIRNYWVYVRD